jgi:hypothetical protein
MPRYHVEGTFPDGIAIPVSKKGAQTCLIVKENNPEDVVTWVHPYITIDNWKLFCIYGAPSPEAIYTAAGRDNMPVDDTELIIKPRFACVQPSYGVPIETCDAVASISPISPL